MRKLAIILSFITIIYNLFEGSVSVFFGAKDQTLALLGFGVDSFVEVISGIGVLHMLLRINTNETLIRNRFEKLALRITGFGFYLLTLGLIAGSIINIIEKVKPNTTVPGLIISVISLLTMYWLMKLKLKVGEKLHSDAIIADAYCTKTCFYLSLILLAASLIYILTGIEYTDILGSLGIAYFSFTEGRESLKKANSNTIECCD
jgi:divalent metal cation (Fe/Co/Zn/Cd) transporter